MMNRETTLDRKFKLIKIEIVPTKTLTWTFKRQASGICIHGKGKGTESNSMVINDYLRF